jgi:hypothetical protein
VGWVVVALTAFIVVSLMFFWQDATTGLLPNLVATAIGTLITVVFIDIFLVRAERFKALRHVWSIVALPLNRMMAFHHQIERYREAGDEETIRNLLETRAHLLKEAAERLRQYTLLHNTVLPVEMVALLAQCADTESELVEVVGRAKPENLVRFTSRLCEMLEDFFAGIRSDDEAFRALKLQRENTRTVIGLPPHRTPDEVAGIYALEYPDWDAEHWRAPIRLPWWERLHILRVGNKFLARNR